MSKRISVLIVDDHRMFREGIRQRLDGDPQFRVIGEASNAEEAIELLGRRSPDIVILDIRLPGDSGIDLARRLRREWPELKILIVSGYDFDQYVRALARIGIQGYLLKDAPQQALVDALQQIAAGGVVLPPEIASKVMRSYSSDLGSRRSGTLWELTLRETEILEHIYEGLRNAEIADRLGISPRTVETHVSNIISKLGVQSRIEAVRKALEKGLIK